MGNNQLQKSAKDPKENMQILISKDKRKYILLAEKNGVSTVVTNFEYANNEMKPSLTLDINRIIRTQKLLKSLPSVFIMHADGKHIHIDAVSKILEFSIPDISGLVQFKVENKEVLQHQIMNIFEGIDQKPQYVIIEDEELSEFQPNTLKVFPIMLQKTAMVCVVDAIEKILHCPIINPKTGFIGTTTNKDYSRLITFQNVWPELDLEFTVKNRKLHVSSGLVVESVKDYDTPVYLRIHRNFGGSDLEIKVTHQMMQDFNEDQTT
jgi:hypothetical protein